MIPIRFFNTIKFKIALRYALLFALSSAICVLIAHLTIRRGLLNSFDQQLESNTKLFLKEYLTGQRHRQYDREIPVSDATPEQLQAFQRKIPGIKLLLGFEKNSNNERFQTFFGANNKKIYELRLGRGGDVYSREIRTANHLEVLKGSFETHAQMAGSYQTWYALYEANGKTVASSPNPAEIIPPEDLSPGFSIRPSKHGDFRIMRTPLFDDSTLEIGQNLNSIQRLIQEYTLLHISIFVAFMLLGTVAGWLIARKFVSGVLQVSNAARDTAGGDFSRRVSEVDSGAEINELVHTFNLMNSHTEKLFNELKMVTDNVAHDLRTPLTRMRGLAEVTVEGPQELNQYREMAGIVADECAQMIQIINTMLEITKTESNIEPPATDELNLNEMISRAVELFYPLAEDGNLQLILKLPDEPVQFKGDRLKLQRMISNLIDNALKFTPPNGTVEVSLSMHDNLIFFQVSDTGCGIKEEDQAHIFERFFRSDASRSRPGNGLGLALVKAIVHSHHGEISVTSQWGKGSCFTVKLPHNQ